MKVFVTGGTGFVGYYIVKQLSESGSFDITVLARHESWNINKIRSLNSNIKIHYGDITDLDSLMDGCLHQDLVIHAAALISFDPRDQKKIYKTNVDGTTNIVNACLSSSVKKLIYISSIAAISDRPDDIDHDESIPWDLKTNHSAYAISKHAAEMEVWRGSAEGLEVGILNPSVIIGQWDEGHHSMQLFKTINNGISFYPTGSTGWVDVRDVAQAVLLYITKDIVNQQLIISGHNMPYREIMGKIARAFKKDISKYAISKSTAVIGSRLYSLMNKILNRKKIVQASIVKSLFKDARYDHKKSIEILEMEYREIDDTIHWVIEKS